MQVFYLPHLLVTLNSLNHAQPQGHVQVLLNMLRGFTAQAALDAPRFCISAGIADSANSDTKNAGNINSEVYFEEGISDETVATLRGQFYRPVFRLRSYCGNFQKWDTMLYKSADSIAA